LGVLRVGTLSALAPLFIAIELRAISKFEKVRNSVYTKIEFPKVKYELYFDMEDDPKQEFVYMHGVCVKGPDGEEYKDFTSTEISEQAEKQAWLEFWDFIRSLPQNS
jgi:predicted RecB family nuclease